jgi:hypothetical protein
MIGASPGTLPRSVPGEAVIYGHRVRHWTLEEATAVLPRVRERVQRIRALVAAADSQAPAGNGDGPSSNGHGGHGRSVVQAELTVLVGELHNDGIIVRDPARGLIDFPARSRAGGTYLLCWLDGEDTIAWWHWPDAGFAGRTPITQPPE